MQEKAKGAEAPFFCMLKLEQSTTTEPPGGTLLRLAELDAAINAVAELLTLAEVCAIWHERHTVARMLKPLSYSKLSRDRTTSAAATTRPGDLLGYRLFNIPVQIYVMQHCHAIGAAVRKQTKAFALARSFAAPCQIVLMDDLMTAHLLRTYGLWRATTPVSGRGKAT